MNPGKRWFRITHSENIPLREGRAVSIGNREIAIFNLGDRFLAIDNRCPHRGGPLADGIVSGTTIVCPLHAWKISLESGQGMSAASAGSCVPTFRTRVDDGVILVELAVGSLTAEEPSLACADPNRPGDPDWSMPLESVDEAWAGQE